MKQIINVRKYSLGVATQFMLPVGELTICTPIRILCNACSLCCLKCSKVIADSCRKTHPCSEFDLCIQNRFKSDPRNGDWINLAFFTE